MISEYQSSSPSSISKEKLKSTLCLSSCFSISTHHQALQNEDDDRNNATRSPKSHYSWLKSTANELPEIRDRCRNLISRLGRTRRPNPSGDFSYDPMSYALNFEDDSRVDEFPLRDFSARLPLSPPPPPPPPPPPSAKYVSESAAMRRQVAAFS